VESLENTAISLSPTAVGIINRILSEGKDVKVHINQKTGELMIYRYANPKLEYKVVVAARQ
jgi:hypothetical protein